MLTPTNSNQNLTVVGDQNNAGSIQFQTSPGSLSYVMDATGCLNLFNASSCAIANSTELGSEAPIFYFADTNQAFATEQPSACSGDNPGLIKVEKQTATSLGTSSINGTYSIGAIPPPTQISVTSGSVTANGAAGTSTAVADNATSAGVVSLGQSGSYTYSVDATGRGTFIDPSGSTSIVYIISPTTAVLVPMSGLDQAPFIIYIQK